jgi:uncharacterized protein (TIGR03067 family)
MYVLIIQVGLLACGNLPPSALEKGEITSPVGTWRVLDIIDGPASSRDGKTVQITGNRLVVTGGEGKEEYVIVAMNPMQGATGTIDLRDSHRRTCCGIYQQEEKRLRICVQFWTEGNAKTSIRPKTFKEADATNVFGPTLYLLERK